MLKSYHYILHNYLQERADMANSALLFRRMVSITTDNPVMKNFMQRYFMSAIQYGLILL